MLTLQDHDLIARDASLEQLKVLFDKGEYEPLITRLAPEPNATDVRLTYLRYKPGINCLAGYEYLVGGEIRYAYTKIFTKEQNDKRGKFAAQAGTSNSEGIVFSFFPNDGKLRSLKKIDSGEKERQFVQRVFSDREDLWAGKIHAIRYKPERRFVSRLVLDGQNKAVVKMHTGNSYARLRNSNKSFKSRENLRMAKRIGHSDRHRILAFEWVPGRLLSDDMRAGTLDAEHIVSVGSALGHIHSQRSDRLVTNGPEMQAEHLEAVARLVSYLCPVLKPRLEKSVNLLSKQLFASSWHYAATHGDFYAKQVLIDGELVGVLDFDESAFDDPMTDLGNFFAHLERDRLRFGLSVGQCDDYQQALLTGYRSTGLEINRSRLALFFAANLFKLLPHPFRFREADWPEMTAVLLDKIQDTLKEKGKTEIYVNPKASSTDICHDDAIPFLGEALDPQEALPKISNAITVHYEGFTVESILQTTLRRHKPGRRCLIEYVLKSTDSVGVRSKLALLGKMRSKKLDVSSYELACDMWNGAFNDSSLDGLYVPEPIGIVPEYNMWLQRKIEGYTADHYLSEPMGSLLCRDIALALHKLNTKGTTPKRSHTIEDEIEILVRRLPLVTQQYPHWKTRILSVLEASRDIAKRIPNSAPVPIHRDFYHDNVLIADNGVYLLDLDLYSLGDAALDAGNFIGHIIECSLRKYGDPYALQTSAQAFMDTFVELKGEEVRLAVELYTTLTLVRHIHISTLFSERRAFTGELLSLCEHRLADYQTNVVPSS